MPTAYTALKLTDGTVTADLVDGTNYQLLDNSWAPAVSARRAGRLAGRPPYEEVIEEITLGVVGTTAAVALANLAKLSYLLDQADRFWAGDDVDPVTLICQPQGSDLTAVLTAMAIGRPPGGPSFLVLPPTFNDSLNTFVIEGVVLRFLRAGLWTWTTETPGGAAAADNPVVQTIDFTVDHPIPSAISIFITGFTAATHLTIGPGIILAQNKDAHIRVFDAQTMTATGWATNADATAAGGSTLRYTATGTAESASAAFDVATTIFDTTKQRISVYANVRVNTAGRTFKLRAEGSSETFADVDATEDRVLPYDDFGLISWIHLGFLNLRKGLTYLNLVASVDNASGSPTLDIDQIAIMVVDSNAYDLRHEAAFLSGTGTNPAMLKVETRPLTDTAPFVGYEHDSSVEVPIGHEGDAAVYMSGRYLSVLWLSNAGGWRDTHSGGTVTQVQLAGKRRRGYLTPQ